jgi:hypothetical protein
LKYVGKEDEGEDEEEEEEEEEEDSHFLLRQNLVYPLPPH